ncbi:MAG: tRNA (adenosine(37)-N6)-dimethylallyltransferase, partial [Planctomycetota bacterium]
MDELAANRQLCLEALSCWFLTGATASGKTVISLELAERLNAEIISLDSMSIYRRMDIGTAKPTLEQRASVPHHLIDIRDPHETFSVSQYRDLAHAAIRDIRSRGKEVLFVGGSALYLKAMLRGLFQGPPADWDFRREVEAEV